MMFDIFVKQKISGGKTAEPRPVRKHVNSNVIRDRPLKSILKAITWRIVGTADTIFISYLLTGKAIIAFSIGSVEVFSKMFLYFLHERAWEMVRWGRMMVRIRRNGRFMRRTFGRLIFKSV